MSDTIGDLLEKSKGIEYFKLPKLMKGLDSFIEKIGSYRSHYYIIKVHLTSSMCWRTAYVELYESELKNIPDEIELEVHGGITYNQKLLNHPNIIWLGFDAAHAGDIINDMEVRERLYDLYPELKRPEDIVLLVGELTTLEYMENECKKLIDQIIFYNNKIANDSV